jgi:glycosyltransferase involved in cell wall biosynthesis
MAQSLSRVGVTVDVATTDDDGPGRRIDTPLGVRLECEGYGLFYFRKQIEFYKCSWPFGRWIRARVRDYDVIHVHALFSYTSNAAVRQARLQRVPCVIRPLGVLNRWGMESRHPFLKRLSFRLIEQPNLRGAAAMHYTSRTEQVEAEQTGATASPEVIPLGIDVAHFASLPGPEIFLSRFPRAAGRTLILFLSRIDPKKGLDLLLPVFAQVRETNPDAILVVAGEGSEQFTDFLRGEAARLGVADEVIWTGFLSGSQKLSALAAAAVYVLPSYSENFGIALVEALAAGLPCVTTHAVGISEDISQWEAGLVVAPQVVPLAGAITLLLRDAGLRARIADGARRLATERFSSAAMGDALLGLYRRITPQSSWMTTC